MAYNIVSWSMGIWELIGHIILILTIYLSYFYFRYFTRSNPLPGPIPLPIVGNRLQYRGHSATWAQKLCEKYGDMCEIYMGSERHIWLSRGDLVSKIFSPAADNNFLIRLTTRDGLDEIDLTIKGLTFNRNVELWKYNRRFCNLALSAPKFLRQTVEKTQELFAEMENYWSEMEQDAILNLSEWINQFTMDVIFVMTTNKRAYSFANYYKKLSRNKNQHPYGVINDSENLIKNIHSWLFALQFFMDTPKFLRDYIPSVNRRAELHKNEVKKLNQIILNIVKDRKQEINRTLDEPLSGDFLTILLTANTARDITANVIDGLHKPMTEDEVCCNMLEVIGAGVDTTANTFCFIVYHLAHYPKVKELVLQELDSVFGVDQNRTISYEDLSKLVYCEAVIKEVSRLMSIVPAIWRMAVKSDEISRHRFEGSTQFMVNLPAIHTHNAHWKDPEAFDPSRFISNGGNRASQIHKNSLLIFGGGLRMCPGKQLAMTELKTLLVLMYRKYDVELVDTDAPIKYHYSTVKHCDNLEIRIKPRRFNKP